MIGSALGPDIMMTDDSFIDFNCPYCQQPVSFPVSGVGSVEECPNCMESIVVSKAGGTEARKPPLPIVTDRLRLRRFTAHDWKGLLALVSDEEGFAYVDGLPGPSEEEVLRWLDSEAHIKLTTPQQILHLAIELQEGNKLLGVAGLWFTDLQRRQARFNLSVHVAEQRKGFGREAVKGLLGFFFEGLKLHRVSVRCDSPNTAARGLLEKAGLRCEGEFVKDQLTLEGGWTNSTWYAVLGEEYPGSQ